MQKKLLLYRIILLIVVLVFAYSVYDFYKYSTDRNVQTTKIGKEKGGQVSDYLNSQIEHIVAFTDDFAINVGNNDFRAEELSEMIILKAKEADIGLGITVAFEPYMFDSEQRLFAQYYDVRQEKLIDLATLYDYTDNTLETTQWYTNVVESKSAQWSSAYYAEGAQQLVADYGSPIYRTSQNGNQEIIGMISFTLGLERFSKYINTLSLGNSGYGILTTKDFQILAHPKTEYINNSEIANLMLQKVPELEQLKTNPEGFIEFYSEYAYQESLLYYSQLENDWTLSVVFNENDILGPAEYLDNKLIHLSLILTIIILLSLFLILKVYEKTDKNLWVFSIVFALLFLLNVAFIWYLNLSVNQARVETYTDKISTPTELKRALYNWNSSTRKIGYPDPAEIPTGIYVSNIDFIGDYDVAISGKVWQKINDSLEITHDLNYVFPQKSPIGLSVRNELVSKTHVKDYWLIRYNFNATLTFDFDYSQYPLDSRLLNIQLMYPDIHENRILVPDLAGYNILNPSQKPGYDLKNYVPEANIISTHYSFDRQDFNSNLGNTKYQGPSDSPVLVFNISVKRNILNPVISNILPIFVIAVLMFLLMFTIHKEDGEIIEGSALSVIQAFGGFFFVLVIAHIQLRNQILAPEISYLETFYFLMYVSIALISSGMLLYVKTDRFYFLEYKNNIILKVGFWPFLIFSIYIISLFKFY